MPFMLAVMLVLAATSNVLPAAASDALQARVVGMLSAIDALPDPRAWRDLGSACVPVLLGVAQDAQQPTFRRARALVVLGHFHDRSATAALERVLDDTASDASLRRHAMLGLSRSAPERALPHVAQALESEDASLRHVAIKILGARPSPEARRLLHGRRDREARPFLVRQIDAALAASP